MVSARRFISSRPVVGIGVLLSVFLLSLWSYCLTLENNTLFLFSGLFLFSFPIVWSFYEVLKLKEKDSIVWIYSLVSYLFVLIPPGFLFFKGSQYLGQTILFSWAICLLFWLFSRNFKRESCWCYGETPFKDKSFSCLVVWIVLFWHILLFCVVSGLWYWIAFIFLIGMLNDSFAFLCGHLFGKRTLSIYSPKKSKEGFWMGVLLSFLVCFCFFMLVPVGVRDLFFGNHKAWYLTLPLMFVGLLIGSWGDLYFSMHKRVFEIKDFSKVLGKHGGFWDRFDSHCFTFIYFGFCCLIYMTMFK